MKDKHLYLSKIFFFVLIAIFILLVIYFLVPVSDVMKRNLFPFAAVLAFLFFIFGAALLFLSWKSKVKGRLKTFLFLTAISAVGFLVSVFLHNFFYALGMIAANITVLRILMEVLHVTFFIIAIPICPIVFLIGAVGGIVKFIKKQQPL
ncbi:hypothetical protein KY348_06425 [Candidatus Woesearchaeota archaeon]|nr:hypothetical protein [Candidatus Woesearchaeota archaeon]